ncbi:hypothetical protein [Eisenibacter elegans]|uniref:hypothetical protein n=1 Tax=Eisenibacter elegans TaxID=997 RepID=UPI0003F733F7|nr:hypothetical protein [Eisenibacter elegans]
MITYSDNDLMRIEYDATLKAVVYAWKKGNHGMTEEQYKTEMRRALAAVQEYKALTVIAYMVDSEFTVKPQLQDWLNTEVMYQLFPYGCRYVIVVLSQDFIARLSIEQVFEEKTENRVGNMFVGSMEAARVEAAKFLQAA